MLRVVPTSPRRAWCLCTLGMGFRLSPGKLQIISSTSTEAQRLWLPSPHNRGEVDPSFRSPLGSQNLLPLEDSLWPRFLHSWPSVGRLQRGALG